MKEEALHTRQELAQQQPDPKQTTKETTLLNTGYSLDPTRDSALLVRAAAPFNAEPPPELLLKSFVTPNDIFFVRNHLPVPVVSDLDTFTVTFSGVGLPRGVYIQSLTLVACYTHSFHVPSFATTEIAFTLAELKSTFAHKTITATIQCAGNRRSEMSRVKNVRGLVWEKTAISTAKWTGVLLADVLSHFGISEEHEVCPAHGDDPTNDTESDCNNCERCAAVIRHVHLEALDTDPTDGKRYGASIPISTALDPRKDVLLAFEMNGEPLPRDHGFPLRAIVPGTVGARNVKFLNRVVLASDESPSFWQQKDYRGFPSNVDYDTEDYFAFAGEAIQELPVQSAIIQPNEGDSLPAGSTVVVQGYAWSGGGRNIVRVDVSTDAGHTWTAATLHPAAKKQRYNRAWAWTPWELAVAIPNNAGEQLEIICKAVDSSYNAQPDTIAPIWNMRGMLNNAWHRVCLQIV